MHSVVQWKFSSAKDSPWDSNKVSPSFGEALLPSLLPVFCLPWCCILHYWSCDSIFWPVLFFASITEELTCTCSVYLVKGNMYRGALHCFTLACPSETTLGGLYMKSDDYVGFYWHGFIWGGAQALGSK